MSAAQVTEAHGLRAEEIVNSWQVGQGVPYLLVLVAQALADAEAAGREQFAKNAIWSPPQVQACVNEIQGALALPGKPWSSAEAFALHLVTTLRARGQS